MMPTDCNKRGRRSESPTATKTAKRAMRGQDVACKPEDDNIPVFEIKVKLKHAFNAFPEQLRSRIESEHKKAIDAQMSISQHDTTSSSSSSPGHIFRVVRGECNGRSRTGFAMHTYDNSFANASLANEFLLRKFRHECTVPLRAPSFVELKTQKGLANKDFVHLHSVRPGKIGWGFDANLRLSLYWAVIEQAELKQRVFYVERQKVKVEIDFVTLPDDK